jgi:hypothetical protein
MTAAFVLTGLRVPGDVVDEIFRGVQVMHESSAFELIENRARQDGEVRRSHLLLLRQGRIQFGPADSATIGAIEAIRDLDRLERMGDAVLQVKSWSDLLSTL